MTELERGQNERADQREVNFHSGCVELNRAQGARHWAGDAAVSFYDLCLYVTRLSDFSIERWVDDFLTKTNDSYPESS